MRDCNVLNIYYIHAIFVNRFLYCNNNTTPRRKYMKSNVLYVVTQGQSCACLVAFNCPGSRQFFREYLFFSEKQIPNELCDTTCTIPWFKFFKPIADINFSATSSSTFLYAL